MALHDKYATLLASLEDWARAKDVRVVLGKPCTPSEVAALPKLFKPRFGTVTFSPPPSYREFLLRWSSWRLKYKVSFDDGSPSEWNFLEEFEIYQPKKAASVTRGTVHMPKGTAVNEGEYLSTNHLIGFAATESSPDCTWCFVTDQPGPRGEYPVVYHDQDEPSAARLLANGKLLDPKRGKPDFEDFPAWLSAQVKQLLKKKRSDFE